MSAKRFVALATLALASVTSSPAFAHAKLQSSEPQSGSTLQSAPKQVRLTFNEALEPAFSKIRVTSSHNAEIPVSATNVDKSDPTVMTASLPALPAGEYRIQWTTMTHDGHKAKGEVTFKVK
jgi:copper resistance protein C